MSTSNKKLIRKLIDLGSGVRGHRINGSDKVEIKKDINRIIAKARTRSKKADIVG